MAQLSSAPTALPLLDRDAVIGLQFLTTGRHKSTDLAASYSSQGMAYKAAGGAAPVKRLVINEVIKISYCFHYRTIGTG